MSYHGKVFGQRDPKAEHAVLQWISDILGEKFPEKANGFKILRDGQVLCKLINKLAPGSVHKIHTNGPQFKMMENINNFTEAIKKYGVPISDLFQTVDLWEGNDMGLVYDTVFALGRTTYKHPEFKGPYLGPRPAEEQKREFTAEQLQRERAVIGLQAGTNKGASQAGQNFGAARRVILGK